ncbi:MAG: hypothetical protein SFW35_11175 [Chitinophagales bacterium]|nr:hypothetical protein [Chitinophagales bacterium]
MKDNKLLHVSKVLSQIELRRFEKYLRYRTDNAVLLALFEEIKAHYPTLDSDDFEREKIWERLFPGKPFNMPQLRYAFSDLTILVEDFLVQQTALEQQAPYYTTLKKWYRSKNLDKYYQQTQASELELIEKNGVHDSHYFLSRFQFFEEQYQYLLEKRNRNNELDLNDVLQDLDKYFLTTKLKHACEIVNRANILKTPFPDALKADLLEYLSLKQYENIPAVGNYYLILETLLEPDVTEHYNRLKEQLSLTSSEFSKEEMRDLYGYAQNYCIRKINGGDLGYLNELLDLYKALLDSGVIFENGYLSHSDFKNIVFVSLRLREFQWCYDFIEQSKSLLNPAQRKNAYTYNLAYYYFFIGDFKKSLTLLNQISFTDIFYFLDSRSLLLKNFYELDEIDPLLSLIDSFRSNLKRNKEISEYQRTIYLNLVKYVNQLLKKEYRNATKIAALQKEIEENKQVADKTWLLQKVAELMS